MKRKIQKGFIALILLFFGLIVFEFFNYYTSKIALDDIFSAFGAVILPGGYVTSLGALLAIGAATIDIGGILRIFTPEQGKHEPAWVQSAYTFWLLASILNAGLTWWVVRLGLMQPVRMPPELVGREPWIAVLTALFVWAIRYGLVRNVGTTGDAFINVQLPNLLPGGGSGRSYSKPKPSYAGSSSRFPTLKKILNKVKASGSHTGPTTAPPDPKKTLLPNTSTNNFSISQKPKENSGGIMLKAQPFKYGGENKSPPPMPSYRLNKGKWSFKDFKQAIKENPRLLSLDKNKLAELAGVSFRTIYRWSEKV